MKQRKTFFGRLLSGIVNFFGSIFSPVFKGAKKSFEDLPEEEQKALIHGSGVMEFISSQIGELPENIQAGILVKFPDINIELLKAGLIAISKGFNLKVDENSVPDLIAKIQDHLHSLEGDTWNAIIRGAAELIAIFLAPKGTKFGAFTSLIEYVYQTFFKKK
jgi:hypothetical protein